MGKVLKTIGYTVAALFVVFALLVVIMSLPFSGWRALSVQTGSMRPAIGIGALVLVHRVPESSLKVGDVITYNSKSISGLTITHRIVAIKQSGGAPEIIVKGDANSVADPPLQSSQVVGKVVKVVPNAGRIINFLHKPFGLILFIYLPALILIFYEIKRAVQQLTKLEVEKRLKERDAVKPNQSVTSNHVTQPIATPKPTASLASDVKPVRRRRTMDGMGVFLIVVLAGITVHATYSLLTSPASLTNNSISVAISSPSPSPTPTPTPSPCIASITGTTGPHSTNIVTCTSSSSSSTTNTNSINITNSNNQSATTGDSTGTSGNAGNINSTATTITANTTY